MGKKKSKRNNRRIAGQKRKEENSPLIVDQVGNGDGIPTSAPGLATVVNELVDETNVIEENTEKVSRNEGKKIEPEPVEKQIEPSPQQPDELENITAPRNSTKEEESQVPQVLSTPLTDAKEATISKDTAVVLQRKKERSGLNKKQNISSQQKEGHVSKKESQLLEHEDTALILKEISISLAENECPPASKQQDSSFLFPETAERGISKGNSALLLKREESTILRETDRSLPLHEREELVVSKKSQSFSLKKKDTAVSKNISTTELQQLFDESARATTDRIDTELNFETTINEESLGSLLDIPALHARESNTNSLNKGVDENRTRRKRTEKSLASRVSAVDHARQVSQGTEKKHIDTLNASTSSQKREKSGKPSREISSKSLHREKRSESERRRKQPGSINKEVRVPLATKGRMMKEASIKGSIRKKAISTDTFPGSEKLQEPCIAAGSRESRTISRRHAMEREPDSRNRSSNLEKRVRRELSTKRIESLETNDLRSSKSQRQAELRQSEISKERTRSRAQQRISKPKPDAEKQRNKSTSNRNNRDAERKKDSARVSSVHRKSRKSTTGSRGKPSVRRSLLPFSSSGRLALGVSNNGRLQLEHGLSSVISQVLETVENKIEKECLVAQKDVRNKSSSSLRK